MFFFSFFFLLDFFCWSLGSYSFIYVAIIEWAFGVRVYYYHYFHVGTPGLAGQ